MSKKSNNRDRSWPPVPLGLPVPVVDNHTHLLSIGDVLPAGTPVPSIAQLIDQAAAVGVDRMVQVGCDLDSARGTVALVNTHPQLLGAIAIHPNEAPLHARTADLGPDGLEATYDPRHAVDLDSAIAEIADLAKANPRIRSIGETGLDLFRSGPQGFATQVESFRAHIALAKELGLALQIHDRDAHQEVIDILLADGAPERTVFHCFSGDTQMAQIASDQGWYLSFAGPVTFKANEELRSALRVTDLGRVLVETDAPYLTPHPYRGRPNAPYLIPVTMQTIAEVKEVDLENACQAISQTSHHVYGDWAN